MNALTATPATPPAAIGQAQARAPLKLDRCPFCQSKAAVARYEPDRAAILCAVCGARGPEVTKEHGRTMADCLRLAVASWNRAGEQRGPGFSACLGA